MKHSHIIIALAATLALSSARGNDAILDVLVKKGVLSQQEANQVREQADREMAQTVELHSKGKFASWLDNTTFSGDFRLRTENFSFENYVKRSDRLRFRYRLRLGMDIQFPDWAKVTVRLASGEASPGDPLSTNQSFTDTWKKKPIDIDAAYVTIQPPGWDWIKVMAGKMDIPIWQPKFNSPMVYDFDDTPEGIAEQLQFTFGDKKQYRVFGQFGQYVLKEYSSGGGSGLDSYLFDMQAGIEAKFGGDAKTPKLKVTGVGGYYMTQNLTNPGYSFSDSKAAGNAANSAGTLWLDDFNVIYGRGEVAYSITDKPFLGTPALLTLSGEVDKNLKGAYETLKGSNQTLDKNQTLGWTVQLAFGEAKKKGQWQIAYQYKHMEADAVWDAISDSDFGIDGSTDREGHIVKGAYCLTDWWQLGCTAFMTHKISNRPNSGHNASGGIGPDHGQDLLRIQVDTVFKF